MEKVDCKTPGGETRHASWQGFIGTVVAYALMIVGAAVILSFVHDYGATLVAPRPATPEAFTGVTATKPEIFMHVLMALTAVIVTGLILAKCFVYLGQPPVIGEVVAGIVLGPSLLGPKLSAVILPPAVAPFLGVIAELGVVLYMFTIGLELHRDLIRGRAGAALAIAHASILVPFVLGALLARGLYPGFASAGK